MTHPGKKLTFMGSEIGQFREWDYAGAVEWFLTDYEKHAKLQFFVAQLNRFYLATPALWQRDMDWIGGFEWIDADNRGQSILSYRRKDAQGKEVIVLLNFQPLERRNFLLAVPYAGRYEEIFNSDAAEYGGTGLCNPGSFKTEKALLRNYGNAIRINVPPMAAVMFRLTRKSAGGRPKKTAKTGK